MMYLPSEPTVAGLLCVAALRDTKDVCAGCGTPTPEWPYGWLFTDKPYRAWCPRCRDIVSTLSARAAALAAGSGPSSSVGDRPAVSGGAKGLPFGEVRSALTPPTSRSPHGGPAVNRQSPLVAGSAEGPVSVLPVRVRPAGCDALEWAWRWR